MDTSLEELQQKFIESGNSKIIVYEEDIDHIAGIYSQFRTLPPSFTLAGSYPYTSFVPETMQAQKLMQTFAAEEVFRYRC